MAAIREATLADQAGNHEDAIRQYMHGLELLQLATRRESEHNAKRIKAEMGKYITRVETLRGIVKGSPPAAAPSPAPSPAPAAPPAAPSSGGAAGSSDGDPADELRGPGLEGKNDEKDKFREGLASAISTESPNVSWDDVAGLAGAKESLKEAVILPIRFPQLFQGKRKPWRGILLYGPPGTGKSYLAKACATEAKSTFFSVTSSDLVSKWLGESEKLVATLFTMAREQKPSIVFLDEVDSLCSARGDGESESARRIKTQFLTEMDGVGSDMDGILVLGATNLPWGLDKAMLRRFERRVYIPLPAEQNVRADMVRINVGTTANEMQEADWQEVGARTEGYSGADMNILVRDAMMQPIRVLQTATAFKRVTGVDRNGVSHSDMLTPCHPDDPDPSKEAVTMMSISDPSKLLEPKLNIDHFRAVLEKSHPSVAQEDLKPFEEFTESYGQEGV